MSKLYLVFVSNLFAQERSKLSYGNSEVSLSLLEKVYSDHPVLVIIGIAILFAVGIWTLLKLPTLLGKDKKE